MGVLPTSVPRPRDQQDEIRRALAENRPSLAEGFGAAFSTQTALPWAIRQISGMQYSADPNFRITDDLRGRLTEGLPEEFWNFGDAVSEDHAWALRDQRLEQTRNLDTLGRMGWTGTALSILASMTDPVDIAAGAAISAASGGTALAPWIAGKAGRLRRLLGHGILGAASAAPVQAYISSQDEVQDEWDVLYAAVGGFAGGAGFDAIGQGVRGALRARTAEAAAETRRAIEFETILGMTEAARGGVQARRPGAPVLQSGDILSDQGRVYFRRKLDPEARRGSAVLLLERLVDRNEDPDFFAEMLEEIGTDPDDFLKRLTADPVEGIQFRSQFAGEPIPTVSGPTGPVELGVGSPPREMQAGDFHAPERLTTDRTAWGFARASYSGILGRSKSDQVVALAGATIEDAVGRRGGTALPQTAEEWAMGTRDGVQTAWQRQQDADFHAWRTDPKNRATDRSERAFGETVAFAIRHWNTNRAFPALLHPSVKAAAERTQQTLADLLALGQRHGVRGLEDVDASRTYLSRLWSGARIARQASIHGMAKVEEVVTAALRAQHPDFDDDVLSRWAKGMIRIVSSTGQISDFERARLMRGDVDRHVLRQALMQEGLDDAQITDVIHQIRAEHVDGSATVTGGALERFLDRAPPQVREALTTGDGVAPASAKIDDLLAIASDFLNAKQLRILRGSLYDEVSEAGRIPLARRRTLLDENVKIDGIAGKLAISDLWENDVQVLIPRYIRSIVGASAQRQVIESMARTFGYKDVPQTWDDLLAEVAKDMQAAGVPSRNLPGVGTIQGLANPTVDQTIELLQQVNRHLLGVPQSRTTAFTRLLNRSRAFQSARVAGGFAFAQLPEFGSIIGEYGLRAAWKSMPIVRTVLDDFRKGAPDDEMVRFLEQLGLGTGAWTDRLRGIDDDLDELAPSAFDRVAHGLNRVQSAASGLRSVDRFQRHLAAVAAMNRWVDIAASGKLPSQKRLASIGMTPEEGEAVFRAIRAEIDAERGIVTTRGPFTGRRVRAVKIDDWADQRAAHLFMAAVHRASRSTVQGTSLGSSIPWLQTSAVGKFLSQFRTFPLQAWDKQFLHNIRLADGTAARRIIASTTFAALAYAAREYAISLSQEDPQAYRDEKLSPSAIMRYGVSRAGWSSMLPSMIDQFWEPATGERLFDFRVSGLSSSMIDADASPSIQFANSLRNTAGGFVRAAAEEDKVVDQRDARRAINLLPFSRFPGVRTLLESMIDDLPEQDPR
jgi:hypothetical protein